MDKLVNSGALEKMPLREGSSSARNIHDLAAALDAAGQGLWICEPTNDHLWPTDWFWRITELRPAQVGASLRAFINCLQPDDGRALTAALERTSSGRAPLEVEVRLAGPDKAVRWLYLKGRALEAESGVIRIIGIVADATAHKLLQQELSRLRANLESLVESSPDIVVRLDAAGKILLASGALQNRIKAESGVTFSLLQHLRDVAAKTVSTGARQQQEACVEFAGRFQWVETRAIPETNPDGGIASVLTFTRDVSDRKLNEDLLLSGRRSLLLAMESMELAHEAANLGYWEWDLATNKGHWSDRVYAMFGLTPGSVTPGYESWIKCVHPEDRKFCDDALEQVYGPSAKYHCQYRIVLPDGSVRWMEDHGKLLRDSAGNPARMIGTITDITEQKEQEAALVHFEKLSSAMRLSSTLAHEINNPLTAVTYLLHLAQQDAKLSAVTRGHLTAAQEELARAAHVALQTLSLYRTPVEKAIVDVSATVQELLRIYSHRLRSRRVEATVRLQDSALACIPAGELRQILSNLLVNAMDAAAAGGRQVFIRVRKIESRHRETPPRVRISVADQGPGIARLLRERIFEPFFTTKESDGIGLGLWITRELVTRNSGRIAVRSGTDEGRSWTVFSITFPAAERVTQESLEEKPARRIA